ncbi:MAG: DUF1559 domain-containing protein [Armatimonadetes bacterium]|nr:DUF1559 domain-containing protein [Armatimonadota bacterium]
MSTRDALGRRGFTLVELLVVIAVVAILAAILMPVFAKARERARQTQCLSNLKQIAAAWQMYAQDHDETACPAYYFTSGWRFEHAWDFTLDWGAGNTPKWYRGLLGPYIQSGAVHHCPSFSGEAWGRPFTGYAYNTTYIGGDVLAGGRPCSLAAIADPAGTVLFAEGGWGDPVSGCNYLRAPSDYQFPWGTAHFRHTGVANVAYADGHVKGSAFKYRHTDARPDVGALSQDDSAYDLR